MQAATSCTFPQSRPHLAQFRGWACWGPAFVLRFEHEKRRLDPERQTGSENIEMITKVLDACGLNQRYWLFAAATTDVEYTITVTDSKTNTTKTYFHAVGSPAPAITDTGAFATCP
jgi:hypothetical protein